MLLDVLGLEVDERATAALSRAMNGRRFLRDDHRSTVEDIRAAMDRGGIREIEPGNAFLFRTGWNQVARSEPDGYLSPEPGIHLREARRLAAPRPAPVGSAPGPSRCS